MKTCTKCGVIKDESEFSKDKSKKGGLQSWCKECQRQYNLDHKEEIKECQKQYYEENKEEISGRHKQYNLDHEEEIAIYEKQYYEENKEEIREYKKEYYQENREKILEQKKLYYLENIEEISIQHKQHYQKNREKILIHQKQYYQDNKEEIADYKKQYESEKYKNDICFKLKSLISSSIRKALKRNQGGKNGGSTLNYLPYTIQELKEHLERQFESWMTWENHGMYNSNYDTWQIDHIVPVSKFRYETMDCEEFRKCWALENLRPLKTLDNIKKGNKI
jgi:hypothetical protein